MRLESVRELKSELLNEIVLPVTLAASARPAAHSTSVRVPEVARALAEASPFAVGATPIPRPNDLQRSIALGIARQGRDFRLAVRVQRQALMDSPLLEHIVRTAHREVDVRFVGRLEKRSDDGTGAEDTLPRKRVPGRRKKKVVFIGNQALAAPWYQQNTRPLLIGASVAHVRVTAGTLGAFVKRGSEIRLLSNNHVLANEDRAHRGDVILQRATADGGQDPADRIGTLQETVRLQPTNANLIDAALADLDPGMEYEPSLLRGVAGVDQRIMGVGPDFLDEGETVHKIGRTTGATTGRVTAFDLDNVIVSYGIGNLRFDAQVEIEGSGTRAFSDGGDSGSLIVNERFQAVGLLFAGSDVGGTNGRGLTYANPIHTVLSGLGVELLA